MRTQPHRPDSHAGDLCKASASVARKVTTGECVGDLFLGCLLRIKVKVEVLAGWQLADAVGVGVDAVCQSVPMLCRSHAGGVQLFVEVL